MSRSFALAGIACIGITASAMGGTAGFASASASSWSPYLAYVRSTIPGLRWAPCGAAECGSALRPGAAVVSVGATKISLDIPLLTNGPARSDLVAFGIDAGEIVSHFAGGGAARWLADEVSASEGTFFLVDAGRTFGTWRVELGQLSHSGNDVLVTLVHL